jgi:hypothetical protein
MIHSPEIGEESQIETLGCFLSCGLPPHRAAQLGVMTTDYDAVSQHGLASCRIVDWREADFRPFEPCWRLIETA